MGIFVDYALRFEGTADEVLARLERVRQRCLDLPLLQVDEVRHVAPVYSPITFSLLEMQGYKLPEEIARLMSASEADPNHGLLCIDFGIIPGAKLPEADITRYIAPAVELIANTDIWRKDDLPATLGQKVGNLQVFSMSRWAIEFDFASVLLRRGYLLLIHPGKGSETIKLGLATFGLSQVHVPDELPLWYGDSFTKTQYAENFVQVHENVCRVLDIVQDEGLLFQGSDTCGYYDGRSWTKVADAVNEELAFVQVASGLVDLAVGNLREEGAHVEVLVDNASRAKLVDFSDALLREQKKGSSGSAPPRTDEKVDD